MEQLKALVVETHGIDMRRIRTNHQDRLERVKRLRARAERARTVAAGSSDRTTRAKFLNTAMSYDNAAEFLTRLSTDRDAADGG
jgi:hypothetical protein